MIDISSPTRVDLAGGTLDLWPIWAMIGGATTINMSIDIRTHCHLAPRDDKRIIIESLDFNRKWEFEGLKELFMDKSKELSFFKAHISYWMPEDGFKIQTKSESPVGGGLGGSSSLSVSIFRAFQKWQKLGELGVHQVVQSCGNIEAQVLQTPTGLQDYYPAAVPGLNIIDFSHSGPILETRRDHLRDLNSQFFVVYTGKSHHSGINNWQVLKNFVDDDTETVKAIFDLLEISHEMKACCLDKKWDQIPRIFEKEYQARMLLADSFSSPEIEKLRDLSMGYGASGFKICGAGGGGCVLVWCDPQLKLKIIDQIQRDGFEVLDTELV